MYCHSDPVTHADHRLQKSKGYKQVNKSTMYVQGDKEKFETK